VSFSTSNSRRTACGSGRYRWWLLRLALCCLLLVTGAALFNLAGDPFGLYQWVVVEGVNANKYPATKHARTVKTCQVERLRPRGLILGSSRSEIGLDPGHPAWQPQVRPVFNLAVGGATVGELRQLFEFACHRQPPVQVVLGVDLFMFNARRGGAEQPPPTTGTGLRSVAETIFSTSALAASAETLWKQDPIKYPGYLANGQIVWTYDLAKVRRYGLHQAFVRNVRKYYANHYFPPPHHSFSLAATAGQASPSEEFSRILELTRRHDVDLRLFISPVHAWQLLAIDAAALWPSFEAWKRELAARLEKDRQSHPGRRTFPLWDFSGFNGVTTEAIPPPGDTTTLMRYYWESSHYRKEAGDLVLSRVLCDGAVPAGFGVQLATANLAPHLESLREGLAAYRRQYPDAVAEIAQVKAEFPYLEENAK
jgi:hypothetical protein